MYPTNMPQCTVLLQQCAHTRIFPLQNGVLWDAGIVPCGIRATGLWDSMDPTYAFQGFPTSFTPLIIFCYMCIGIHCFNIDSQHDDVIKWEHFPRYWPFVWGIHRSPVNFPHKGQWRGAFMFTLIYAWINGWVNNLVLVISDAIAPLMTSL